MNNRYSLKHELGGLVSIQYEATNTGQASIARRHSILSSLCRQLFSLLNRVQNVWRSFASILVGVLFVARSKSLAGRLGDIIVYLYSLILRIRCCHNTMNEYMFVIRTDKNLHDRIRKLAYLANTSRSAAIRKLLQSQNEEEQLIMLNR